MNFDDARRLVAERSGESPCLEELHQALLRNLCQPVEPGPGRMSARITAGTFEIRQQTAAAAGGRVSGLGEALERLRSREGDDPILLFHFGTAERLYTVFVAEGDRSLVGCVSVERRPPG